MKNWILSIFRSNKVRKQKQASVSVCIETMHEIEQLYQEHS